MFSMEICYLMLLTYKHWKIKFDIANLTSLIMYAPKSL